MSKKYFVWKDPACGGADIEWTELSGQEFYAMMSKPENKCRRFIRLGNDICSEDDVLTIEATETEYRDWKREQNAHEYLKRCAVGIDITSLENTPDDAEVDSLNEIIADTRVNVERTAWTNVITQMLEGALDSLTDDERRIISAIYFEGMTSKELGQMLGVSQPTAYRRLIAVIEKMKKSFFSLNRM